VGTATSMGGHLKFCLYEAQQLSLAYFAVIVAAAALSRTLHHAE
jgi:hypothetical protein